MSDRLEGPHYMVFWKSRVMTPDRQIREARVSAASQHGFIVEFEQALPLGSNANIELYVKYRGATQRLRAKTSVVYCRVLSNNAGAVLELRTTYISNDDMHTYNNILQTFANSKEFQLRK
ncbi:hypothetical protein P886_3926 [Alteromonadaceae bacterium 2753L.S.0a.02]|nr:hypothetical protein P886_3926 [Alteromonadaceae bacterium 2753L.S.0a.02]